MNELIQALTQVTNQTGIDKELVFEALETSILAACKRNFGTSDNIDVNINRKTGDYTVTAKTDVVSEADLTNKNTQISISDALKIDSAYQIGDVCQVPLDPKKFGRIAAQNAKQIIVQRLHEEERSLIYNDYKSKEFEMVTGLIQRKERGNVYLNLDDKVEALLPAKEQIVGEEYPLNRRIKVYVEEVKDQQRGPMMIVSRTHPELIKRLFEQEVPEIHDGIVMIKSIAREAGSRSKMAVYSRDPMVDPLGACVGPGGNRVNAIVKELGGEKIDIVIWSQEPSKFIAMALNPSEVDRVDVDEEGRTASVVVPDSQLSLAIGKEGQNARLAAKLTGYKIDIKSETQAKQAQSEDDYDFDFDFDFSDEDEEADDEMKS